MTTFEGVLLDPDVVPDVFLVKKKKRSSLNVPDLIISLRVSLQLFVSLSHAPVVFLYNAMSMRKIPGRAEQKAVTSPRCTFHNT